MHLSSLGLSEVGKLVLPIEHQLVDAQYPNLQWVRVKGGNGVEKCRDTIKRIEKKNSQEFANVNYLLLRHTRSKNKFQ